ncbi:hypothetical protein PN36_32125 [Candidatus Thiomargarita nelsonii]|uniref:Uncharacterized protein n=1 Tax=Candidatus Thiomargarita nelsonii TaxID=1003181 RepID=A0A4E0QNQ1_9GAMM|nr:hypothetical protein PN36_32125 [Candidatus Thiomargarita nelsonii]
MIISHSCRYETLNKKCVQDKSWTPKNINFAKIHKTIFFSKLDRLKLTFLAHITFYPDDTPGRDRIAHLWGLANGMRWEN